MKFSKKNHSRKIGIKQKIIRIRKTLKIVSYVAVILILNLTISSCSGDDGEKGLTGENGNANVQTIRFQSPQWTSSTHTFFKQMHLEIPQITYEDINFSVILHYISFQNQTYALLPVDNHFINGIGAGFSISARQGNQSSTIRISKTASVVLPNPTPSVDFLKIIIIKPSETTTTTSNNAGKLVNTKAIVQNELQNANVDINDYYAVCKYYNIEPK